MMATRRGSEVRYWGVDSLEPSSKERDIRPKVHASTRRLGLLASVVAVLNLLSACSGDTEPASAPDAFAAALEPGELPTLTHEIHETPRVGVELVARIENGTALLALDSGFLMTTKHGELVFVPRDDDRAMVLLDLTDDVSTDSERGLLGVALHPDGDRLYVSLTNLEGDNELREYPFEPLPEPAVGETFRLVFSIEQPYPEHNGGHLVFGPDGMLYIGIGDGGSDHDPFNHAQNPHTPLGSILRLDPTGAEDGEYRIPPGNPFAEGAGDPRVWVMGLRNPWQFWIDPLNEDLWLGDVGHNETEEINRVARAEAPGSNFGWSVREGSRPNPHSTATAHPGELLDPLWEYPHEGEACAVIGGFVYRGEALDLQGQYLFADLCIGNFWALGFDESGQVLITELGNRIPNPVAFSTDLDGEPLVLSLSSGLVRLVEP